MDGLSGAASIIAVIDLSAKVASLCFQYSTAVKYAKDDIERVQGKLDDINRILKQVKQLLEKNDKKVLPTTQSISGSLEKCLEKLANLQAKLDPGKARKTMSRVGLRALKWPFTSKQVDEIVAKLEEYIQTFSSALQVDQTAVVINIDQKLDLAKLPIAQGASYDSYMEEHNARCLPNTRTTLLQDIKDWAQDKGGKPVFWLSGMAGTGKSTIARTIAESLASDGQLGASFFFKRGEGERGNASRFFTTIAVDLAVREPGMLPGIRRALDEDSNISGKILKLQFEKLILQPILEIKPPSSRALARVIVIDALDECEREADIRTILQLLARTKDISSVPLRVVVTSRPELHVRLGFREMPNGTYQDLVLHEVPRSTIEHDIHLFLEHELSVVRKERNLLSEWPTQQQILTLVELAVPLFIYAATMCRYIGSKGGNPIAYLTKVLQYQKTSFSQLDRTYLPVLDQLLSEQEEDEKETWLQTFREIVGCIAILQSPLSTVSLGRLLQIPKEEIQCLLDSLHSVLSIPASEEAPVRLLHLSFREFLIDPQKEEKIPFWVNEKETHKKLASRCLETMSGPSGLHQDMCSLSKPGTLRSELDEERIASRLSPDLLYACRYWIDHLKQSQQEIFDKDTTHLFLQKHFLHWLEAMSLVRLSNRCVRLLTNLQTLVSPSAESVLAFLHDAKRFVLRFHFVLAEAPLQVYYSALLLAPERSLVRRAFANQMSVGLENRSTKATDWDACYSTLEGHTAAVAAVVFSPDGQLIVSGSYDRTLRLWEVDTGSLRSILEGHRRQVERVIFSPDGQVLASSCCKEVRLWNVVTGTCCHTLEEHPSFLSTLTFRSDGKLLGSICGNEVRLWDVKTGVRRSILEGHDSGHESFWSFSPDGKLVVCGSGYIIQVLETETGICRHTFEDHSQVITAVAFSPNAQLVASASRDHIICFWEVETGECRGVIKGPSGRIWKLVFSPNGQLVASLTKTSLTATSMRLCEVETGKCRSIVEGSSGTTEDIAFSPDGSLLMLGSGKTVQLWDTATGICYNRFEGHLEETRAVAFSPDGQLVASASGDATIRLWEVRKETHHQTVESDYDGYADYDWFTSLVFSPNGLVVASASCFGAVQLWNVETATCHSTLTTGWAEQSIWFSQDGQILHTSKEDFPVPGNYTAKLPPISQEPSSRIQVEDAWIMRNEQRFLWLPPEYRPEKICTRGDVVCLGLKSGRLVFLRIP